MDGKLKILCIPFSGGTKYSYREYMKAAPENAEVLAFELPGRGNRPNEPFIRDINYAVEDLYQQIKSHLSDNFILYGHSLGALLAFLLVQKLMENQQPIPKLLVLTGTKAPSYLSKRAEKLHLLSSEDFMKRLKNYGGCPEEILADEDVMRYFEPIIRADFQVLDSYEQQNQNLTNLPFLIINGSEEDISQEQVSAWQAESSFPIRQHKIEGNHFFFIGKGEKVINLIIEYYYELYKKTN